MRTDAADTFQQIDVLKERPFFACFFNAAVVVTQTDINAEDFLALQGYAEALRLL
jgi:hypothetical protein